MGKVEVLDTKGDYTLLKRESSYEPYVVAWKFDKERGDWCQGHYFHDKFSAECFFKDRAINFAW